MKLPKLSTGVGPWSRATAQSGIHPQDWWSEHRCRIGCGVAEVACNAGCDLLTAGTGAAACYIGCQVASAACYGGCN
jgi:hypothetical protein